MSSIEAMKSHGRWVENEEPIELKVGFSELVLIHTSLVAVRTLGLVAHQDGLLTDTLQLVDVALEDAL
jgi:hypothetical protein